MLAFNRRRNAERVASPLVDRQHAATPSGVATNLPTCEQVGLSLEGKVAVITAGRQGVGLGITHEFMNHGTALFVTARRQTTLDQEVAALGPKSAGIVGDDSKLAEM